MPGPKLLGKRRRTPERRSAVANDTLTEQLILLTEVQGMPHHKAPQAGACRLEPLRGRTVTTAFAVSATTIVLGPCTVNLLLGLGIISGGNQQENTAKSGKGCCQGTYNQRNRKQGPPPHLMNNYQVHNQFYSHQCKHKVPAINTKVIPSRNRRVDRGKNCGRLYQS